MKTTEDILSGLVGTLQGQELPPAKDAVGALTHAVLALLAIYMEVPRDKTLIIRPGTEAFAIELANALDSAVKYLRNPEDEFVKSLGVEKHQALLTMLNMFDTMREQING